MCTLDTIAARIPNPHTLAACGATVSSLTLLPYLSRMAATSTAATFSTQGAPCSCPPALQAAPHTCGVCYPHVKHCMSQAKSNNCGLLQVTDMCRVVNITHRTSGCHAQCHCTAVQWRCCALVQCWHASAPQQHRLVLPARHGDCNVTKHPYILTACLIPPEPRHATTLAQRC